MAFSFFFIKADEPNCERKCAKIWSPSKGEIQLYPSLSVTQSIALLPLSHFLLFLTSSVHKGPFILKSLDYRAGTPFTLLKIG